jgi:hypothetical protein
MLEAPVLYYMYRSNDVRIQPVIREDGVKSLPNYLSEVPKDVP